MTTNLVTISLVPTEAQAPVGRLASIDVHALKKAIRKALNASYVVPWAALGIDFSVNDERQRGNGIFWQMQLYGIASVTDRVTLGSTLSEHFPKSDTVRRPVRIADYDLTRYGASYAFKTGFVRRVGYWDQNGKSPCWQTRKVALKAKEHVELLLVLDKLGLSERLLLYRVNPEITSDGVILRKLE